MLHTSAEKMFLKWAEEIVYKLENSLADVEDIKVSLAIIYMAGVIDSAGYSDKDKETMYASLKEIYPQLNAGH